MLLDMPIIVFVTLVPRGHAPFGYHQESQPLARSNNGSPRFTDFPSLCACSESSLANLIGPGLNLLCLQSYSKPECCWTWPEVAILGADQKEHVILCVTFLQKPGLKLQYVHSTLLN